MASRLSTPGVYINEINAFPNSVVPIATAVPAFIGYTPRADYAGKSLYNTAQKITSFAEFQAYFMLDNPLPPVDPARQYSPEYYLVLQKSQPSSGEYLTINGQYYSVLPDPSTLYYLYNSIRLFYENGGGDAWVVAVGPYGVAGKQPMTDLSAKPVNPNVKLTDLLSGLAVLQNEQVPTLYICPEATLLSVADNGTLMQAMLLQAQTMQTALCVFDIIGGANPDPILYTQDIQTFRDATGSNGLQYGTCYYPFIGTNIMSTADIDFTNLFGGDIAQLAPLLNPSCAPNPVAESILQKIQTPSGMSNSQLQAALLNASEAYAQIVQHVLHCANVLPASGAMAGVYTVNDNMSGVWNAPANCTIVGATELPIRLGDTQQANLNIDAVSGKSVNAIRFFNGQGILIWGARTLDGNSQDWRYIPVRRTMTFLEQSVKLAARAYSLEPNNANTWAGVKSMISNFLMDIWKQGGLQGSSPADAFQVNVGLGTTMTSDDLLNGYLRVSVLVAVVRPAEFLVISFEQEQAKSG